MEQNQKSEQQINDVFKIFILINKFNCLQIESEEDYKIIKIDEVIANYQIAKDYDIEGFVSN